MKKLIYIIHLLLMMSFILGLLYAQNPRRLTIRVIDQDKRLVPNVTIVVLRGGASIKEDIRSSASGIFHLVIPNFLLSKIDSGMLEIEFQTVINNRLVPNNTQGNPIKIKPENFQEAIELKIELPNNRRPEPKQNTSKPDSLPEKQKHLIKENSIIWIWGKVTTKAGEGIEGIIVYATGSQIQAITDTTSSIGAYRIELPPNTNHVVLTFKDPLGKYHQYNKGINLLPRTDPVNVILKR